MMNHFNRVISGVDLVITIPSSLPGSIEKQSE